MKKSLICCITIFCSMMITITANTRESATLAKCVDGDTTHFVVHGNTIKVRYLAIDAPEYTKEKEPYGKEASDYVCDILTNAQRIELEYDDGSDGVDKYGRTLAWVYADGELLQAGLVNQGLAEVNYIYGDYACTEELKALEKQAKKENRNMWSKSNQKDEETTKLISIVGGVVFILFGVFFAKGKRNKKKWVQKGIKKLKH